MNALASAVTWCLRGHQDGTTTEIPIRGDRFVVGRRSENELCIPKPTVSGAHAQLSVVEGQSLFAEDLGSTNGTFLNGKPLKTRELLQHGDLIQFADEVYQVGQTSSRVVATLASDSADSALALIQFNRLIDEHAVMPFFQSVVNMGTKEDEGYEVLGRSRLVGLSTPDAMFKAAAKFSMESELSRLFRDAGTEESIRLPGNPTIFLNTHPLEMVDIGSLKLSLRNLREKHPSASLVLEIHEGAVANPRSIANLKTCLRELEIGLAYDDFGAGQARLEELIEAPPDILKFDMSLVRGIHAAGERKQNMLAQLVKLTIDLGVCPLAEGVETEEDHVACAQMGFGLGQGYHYGRPTIVENLR